MKPHLSRCDNRSKNHVIFFNELRVSIHIEKLLIISELVHTKYIFFRKLGTVTKLQVITTMLNVTFWSITSDKMRKNTNDKIAPGGDNFIPIKSYANRASKICSDQYVIKIASNLGFQQKQFIQLLKESIIKKIEIELISR